MKKIFVIIVVSVVCQSFLIGQTINHQHADLLAIPTNWIDSAKANLNIGYGHTSHGSQIISGMNALESYFTDGDYNWSHTGGENTLLLYEGDGYGDGDLDHDIGYVGWDDETREYLNAHPECNVLIWSWCGQVNGVNLQTHLFDNMEALETEYPDVTFVYMTGHLEGLGANGSVYLANQQIRDYCSTNSKFLFDFADIEKYCPDADTNFQIYLADQDCTYQLNGQTRNWATDWLNANPAHDLTKISAECGSCSHSASLNCVKKGVAAWHLWAQLAGWEGTGTVSNCHPIQENTEEMQIKAYVNSSQTIYVDVFAANSQSVDLTIYSISGCVAYNKRNIRLNKGGNKLSVLPQDFAKGIYFIEVASKKNRKVTKFIYN